MLRLFLRLYLFLMLPATIAVVGLMYVTDQVMAQMHAEQQRQRAGVAFDRAERIVLDNRVPDWQGRLKEIEATFRVAHEVVPMDKALADFFMSSSEKDLLRSGQIAFRDRPGGGKDCETLGRRTIEPIGNAGPRQGHEAQHALMDGLRGNRGRVGDRCGGRS